MAAASKCNHHWIKDGNFVENSQMWSGERAHTKCVRCTARTWMTRREWKKAKKARISEIKRVRVGAILEETKGTVMFLGWGTYVGNFFPALPDYVPEAIKKHVATAANPKIVLDSGDVVWGYECWWDKEEIVRSHLEGKTIIHVDINTVRKEIYTELTVKRLVGR